MPVRGVVRHEIENDLQAARMRRRDQRVEIGERAEHRIDIGIVRDIVAEVRHRRGIDRRDPDGVSAELDQMIEPRRDALQVTDAVTVGVLKRARIDLIDDSALPPAMHVRHGRFPWLFL
jgi:hypothetical protein